MGHRYMQWSSLLRNTNWTCHFKRLMCKHAGIVPSSSSSLMLPLPLLLLNWRQFETWSCCRKYEMRFVTPKQVAFAASTSCCCCTFLHANYELCPESGHMMNALLPNASRSRKSTTTTKKPMHHVQKSASAAAAAFAFWYDARAIVTVDTVYDSQWHRNASYQSPHLLNHWPNSRFSIPMVDRRASRRFSISYMHFCFDVDTTRAISLEMCSWVVVAMATATTIDWNGSDTG